MYCECFHLQIFCNENCDCVGCGNMEATGDHQQAVFEALSRNPKAFNDDNPENVNTSNNAATANKFKLGVGLNEVKKGCRCKKTKCQKKYCECFNSGQLCGIFCKCEGCANCSPTEN